MRLVEGVGREFLPVLPDLIEHLLVVAVLLPTFIEQGLKFVHLVDLLFTHRLTQGVALATGKVSQLSRQQHDLLLIDSDAIGLFEVFLHARDIIFDRLTTMLAVDELRDIFHGTWAIQGIHGNQVLKAGRMKIDEVFLHTR